MATQTKEATYQCESCNRQIKASATGAAPQCCGKPMKKTSQ